MIVAALAVALVVRTYVHVIVFTEKKLRDANGFVLHLLCLGLSLAAIGPFHITLRSALAAAFIADGVVQLRELLDVIADLCKIHVLNTRARRR